MPYRARRQRPSLPHRRLPEDEPRVVLVIPPEYWGSVEDGVEVLWQRYIYAVPEGIERNNRRLEAMGRIEQYPPKPQVRELDS